MIRDELAARRTAKGILTIIAFRSYDHASDERRAHRVRRPNVALCIVFIAAIACIAPASADMTTRIENSAVSPIQITGCSSDLRGVDGIPDAEFAFGVNFINHGTQPATAIRFNFRLLDAFGNLVMVQPADKLGTFSPGVPIGNPPAGAWGASWTTPNGVSAVTNVTCQVETVRFTDGSLWKRPNETPFEPTMPALPP
jgi:hypothetical protein